MKKQDLFYTAGLFDGEGTVTISKHRSSDMFRKPVVSVSSTTYEILEFLKENFGGYISKHKVYQDHHKQSWSWKLADNAALEFLEKIHPYLKEPEKIRRAKLLVNEYKFRTPRNGRYTEDQIVSKKLFENQFLNGGVGGTP